MKAKPVERLAFATTLLLIAAALVFSPRKGGTDGSPLEFLRETGRKHLPPESSLSYSTGILAPVHHRGALCRK